MLIIDTDNSCEGNFEFKLEIVNREFDSQNVYLYNSFIEFPEFNLQQGYVYKIRLQITSDIFENPILAYDEVISNQGPVCSGLNIFKDYNSWIL